MSRRSQGSAGARGSFPLVIVTALDPLQRPEQAGALAALMQGGGFLIAAFGPFAMALLHGRSESFGSGAVMQPQRGRMLALAVEAAPSGASRNRLSRC